jgi:hypothetical protein
MQLGTWAPAAMYFSSRIPNRVDYRVSLGGAETLAAKNEKIEVAYAPHRDRKSATDGSERMLASTRSNTAVQKAQSPRLDLNPPSILCPRTPRAFDKSIIPGIQIMAIEEISKRFTLRDLFGFLLPGCLALFGIVAFAILGDVPSIPEVAVFEKAFRQMPFSIQIVAFVVIAYVFGLLSISLGDLVYSSWRRTPGGTPNSEDTRAFNESVRKTLRRDIEDFVPAKEVLSPKDKLSIVYSRLIGTQKDGFVQRMFGLGAIFLGMTSAFLLIAMLGVIPYPCIHWHEFGVRDCVVVGLILVLIMLLEFWAICKALAYDDWWKKQVVYGFITLPKPESSKRMFRPTQHQPSKAMIRVSLMHLSRNHKTLREGPIQFVVRYTSIGTLP